MIAGGRRVLLPVLSLYVHCCKFIGRWVEDPFVCTPRGYPRSSLKQSFLFFFPFSFVAMIDSQGRSYILLFSLSSSTSSMNGGCFYITRIRRKRFVSINKLLCDCNVVTYNDLGRKCDINVAKESLLLKRFGTSQNIWRQL